MVGEGRDARSTKLLNADEASKLSFNCFSDAQSGTNAKRSSRTSPKREWTRWLDAIGRDCALALFFCFFFFVLRNHGLVVIK